MKPEFPKLYAVASMWIATPLLGICTVIYVHQSIFQPAASTFPIGLSAFGVTAALSGISFSMARACENPATAKYAGEKFLHSAILLIQGLFLIYLRDAVGEIDLLKPWPYLVFALKAVAVGLLSLITAVASWTWYFGFEELNKFFMEELGRKDSGDERSSERQGYTFAVGGFHLHGISSLLSSLCPVGGRRRSFLSNLTSRQELTSTTITRLGSS